MAPFPTAVETHNNLLETSALANIQIDLTGGPPQDALIECLNVGKKSVTTPTQTQNRALQTILPLTTDNTTHNNLLEMTALPDIPMDLTGGQPLHPTDCKTAVITHVMAKAWGISSPRYFQAEAIAHLVFDPNTCL